MPREKTRERLDLLCVARGLAPSRARAQALIAAGQILVDERVVAQAGTAIPLKAELRLRGEPLPFVSRGGLKLAAALDHFQVACDGVLALDIGASTGGFTDCLLQRGARHVVAIDVGYGQLAWKLRQDTRVSVIERTNARQLSAEALRQRLGPAEGWPPTLATVDVSFISLRLVLPSIVTCLAPAASIVALVKPQFEVGRAGLARGGVVRDPETRAKAISDIAAWARARGLTVVGGVDAPIAGPKGNLEHLLLLTTPARAAPARP
ncbi:MAG: TlyA family RNA methyltransferase [Proteobacteria bacterium]|nr:TlyA family RNA methyltransferase [Pseudomonadota bacterium]